MSLLIFMFYLFDAFHYLAMKTKKSCLPTKHIYPGTLVGTFQWRALRDTNLGVAQVDLKLFQKRTYRQHLNQYNQAKGNSIDSFAWYHTVSKCHSLWLPDRYQIFEFLFLRGTTNIPPQKVGSPPIRRAYLTFILVVAIAKCQREIWRFFETS